jgi:phage shock protein E
MKSGKAVLYLLVCMALVGWGMTGQQATSPTERTFDSVEVVQEALDQGALFVDVRTAVEFELMHFKGAVNIDVRELMDRLAELGWKERTIVVHCRSGGRSARAKKMLLEAGYANVLNVGGLSEVGKLRR